MRGHVVRRRSGTRPTVHATRRHRVIRTPHKKAVQVTAVVKPTLATLLNETRKSKPRGRAIDGESRSHHIHYPHTLVACDLRHPSSPAGARTAAKKRKRGRGRPPHPENETLHKFFTRVLRPNMAYRARCKLCGWERAAIAKRMHAHLASHAGVGEDEIASV